MTSIFENWRKSLGSFWNFPLIKGTNKAPFLGVSHFCFPAVNLAWFLSMWLFPILFIWLPADSLPKTLELGNPYIIDMFSWMQFGYTQCYDLPCLIFYGTLKIVDWWLIYTFIIAKCFLLPSSLTLSISKSSRIFIFITIQKKKKRFFIFMDINHIIRI